MPKETFFRLHEEKQQRLIEAARKEFSSHSLKDASVNQIIRYAGIPRGSFYQYFEDIEDLYFYYFSLLRKNELQSLTKAFKKANGDFFEGIEIYFKHFIDTILKGPDEEFYRNLFTNLDFHSSDKVMPFHGKTTGKKKSAKEAHRELFELIDFSLLDVTSEREFMILFKLIMGVFFSSVNDAYLKEEAYSKEEIIHLFQLRLNWLKYGAYKNKKGEKL